MFKEDLVNATVKSESNKNDSNKKFSEEDVYRHWVENNIFEETIKSNQTKPEYVFYDGPPFATGLPHYGHILAGLIKDTVLRHAHNKGYNVPRFAGYDTHGLPIEYEIEKELHIKTTQQVLDYGIDKYNDACKAIVLRCADKWEEQMGRLGRWIDLFLGFS
jgi:isoleucyl-tRNA synthetase